MDDITVFLGAGFSRVAGFPLATEILDVEIAIDTKKRADLQSRVQYEWSNWRSDTRTNVEEYLAMLQIEGAKPWYDAQAYVALVIAAQQSTIRWVGDRVRYIQNGIQRAPTIESYTHIWQWIEERYFLKSVVTTNYDLLAEQGLRIEPRPKLGLPGFHYGKIGEIMKGGGYPSYSHVRPLQLNGRVPLHKLHGSVNWAGAAALHSKYWDPRPAIKGDCALIAPAASKSIPKGFSDIWERASHDLERSNVWLVIGYSLPPYDKAVRSLFQDSVSHVNSVLIANPAPLVVERFSELLPNCDVESYPGFPEFLYKKD
ncbi:MAG: SIR2 family protein [Chloroflexi bacterium]|nr:SIR2 family protein [Chloroflexota bacterium]